MAPLLEQFKVGRIQSSPPTTLCIDGAAFASNHCDAGVYYSAMNLREGTRRLGFVAGILGATGGLFGSYLHFEDMMERRNHYRAFTKLNSSPIVRDYTKDVNAMADKPSRARITSTD